ncbi:hypothetical protein [Nitrospira defluvii]|uniref:Uncharacterized protein n=1 Tax=Nitrospira defluvii TaxID=330214 RepID=A0ABM8RZ61_9BACT|nr:hypothetical protein [Nitrospira defluvii]CAE6779383.1 hypothetical protein NSPZN2_40678 [Nitrospira defluvii]
MAKKPNKRLSSWARHRQRIAPTGLLVIVAAVRGVRGAPADASYMYAVDTSHRRRTSPLVILPPVSVPKGHTVLLIPGRSEAGDESSYTFYRSAPNGDRSTLRPIAHVEPLKSAHSKVIAVGYYRDELVPLESRVSVVHRRSLRERGKRSQAAAQ